MWMNDQTRPAVADERHLALTHRGRLLAVRPERGVRAVEPAVPQHQALGPGRRGDGVLDVLDRGDGLLHAGRRRRSERVVLGLHHRARAVVAGEEALRHEPLDAHRLRGGQQVVGALGAQPVGLREGAVEVPQVHRADRRQLVHDDVRLGGRHGGRHLLGVQRVRHHRRRTQLAQHRLLGLAARHRVHRRARPPPAAAPAAAPSLRLPPATNTFIACSLVSSWVHR